MLLFSRTGRHLALTQAGRVILPRVHAALNTCEGCIDQRRSTGTPQVETVVLACLPMLAVN
ncbi:MAG: hypothetical protein ACRET4_06265 [Steroidobacteraceae bacterium]